MKNKEIELLNIATEIIQTEGFENLSVRKIATKANCSVGFLYNYFRDMNELILKINGNTLLKLREAIAKAVSIPHTRHSLGKALAKEYLNFAKQNSPFWNLLFKYKIPENQLMPEWFRSIIEDNFQLLESALRPLLKEKQVHKASRVLWGACHGIILLSMDGKLDIASSETPESLCQSLFENYLKGLN